MPFDPSNHEHGSSVLSDIRWFFQGIKKSKITVMVGKQSLQTKNKTLLKPNQKVVHSPTNEVPKVIHAL